MPFVWVTDYGDDTIDVIDAATSTVIETISEAAGQGPFPITILPSGQYVYVGNYNPVPSNVAVFNANTYELTATIDIPLGSRPWGIAASPDGKTVWVANRTLFGNFNYYATVIETATNAVIQSVQVPKSPCCIAFSPDGSLAYVASSDSHSVSIVDASTYSVSTPFTNLSPPFYIAVAPDGQYAYVSDASRSITVLDLQNNTVVGTPLDLGFYSLPIGIVFSPDGEAAYVATASGVVVLNTGLTPSVNTTIPTPTNLYGIALSQEGDMLFTANETNTVYQIAVSDFAITPIPVGFVPLNLFVQPIP